MGRDLCRGFELGLDLKEVKCRRGNYDFCKVSAGLDEGDEKVEGRGRLASLSVELGRVEVVDDFLDGRDTSVHLEVSCGRVSSNLSS